MAMAVLEIAQDDRQKALARQNEPFGAALLRIAPTGFDHVQSRVEPQRERTTVSILLHQGPEHQRERQEVHRGFIARGRLGYVQWRWRGTGRSRRDQRNTSPRAMGRGSSHGPHEISKNGALQASFLRAAAGNSRNSARPASRYQRIGEDESVKEPGVR